MRKKKTKKGTKNQIKKTEKRYNLNSMTSSLLFTIQKSKNINFFDFRLPVTCYSELR